MQAIDLGSLANGAHADMIRQMATNCAADERIQAIWVGGSLAAGSGDRFSDIDFRIAVGEGEVDQWAAPEWTRYLPLQPSGGNLMRFGEHALLHHLVLTDGTIVDFFVQDTSRDNFEPHIVVLACRDASFRPKLAQFAKPATLLTKPIEGAAVRQFLVDYWIISHKQLKALARRFDLSPFVGLYWERLSLLRAWHMEKTGQDIVGRATIHMLGKLHQGLDGQLTTAQQAILGMPSRSPIETAEAIEATRAEMSQVGRWLAQTYAFDYPAEMEEVVLRVWHEHKAASLQR